MDKLKQTLRELHEQLEQADDADPELQQWLQVLDADIHKLLAAKGGPGAESTESDQEAADDSVDDADLASRADDVARRFAARHPHLEPVLRQISDALARLGI